MKECDYKKSYMFKCMFRLEKKRTITGKDLINDCVTKTEYVF